MTSELNVSLNIGGQVFMTSRETLLTYPHTLLGQLASSQSDSGSKTLELSFDRNAKVGEFLVDFYRTGELHLPEDVCSVVIERELKFWQIPATLVTPCCWKRFEDGLSGQQIITEIDVFMRDRYLTDTQKKPENLTTKNKIWLTMEKSNFSTTAKVSDIFFHLMVYLLGLSFKFITASDLYYL